jgi:phosphate starvation-inducible membrane PsiE
VVGNAESGAPLQIAATGVKVGITFGLTVIVKVVVVAQSPAVGVKVYVVVVVLFNAGDQVPVMPFKEVVGNAESGVPLQIAATGVKVGITFGLTVIVKVVVVAQSPAVGVKVYVVVFKLSNAGDQEPVIPFKEVVGNAVKDAPLQIAATGVKVGIIFGLTVIVNVVVVAHKPAVGVNVYVVVVVLFNAGDQVPVIPFKEVFGSAVKLAPEQIAATGLKVGIIFRLTVIVNVVVVAHKPAVGVKVYVVVVVLFNAGDQEPVIPFKEVVGNAESGAPLQIAATGINVGITFGLTVIVNVVVVAHKPAVGVNV